MKLLLTGHHVDLNPSLRQYVEEKLSRVVSHFDRILEVEVILGSEKPAVKEKRQRAEATLRVSGKVFHLTQYAEDLYKAIDGLATRLDRQVLRHKEKMQEHRNDARNEYPHERPVMPGEPEARLPSEKPLDSP